MKAAVANPFERYKGIEKPDEKKEIKTEPSGLEQLLKEFEGILDENTSVAKMHENLSKTINTILSPEQINQFLQMTLPYEGKEYYGAHTAIFMTVLIQKSFEAGHNNFYLKTNTISKPLCFLCWKMKGEEKRPLKLTIEGSTGSYFAWHCSHVELTIDDADFIQDQYKTSNTTMWVKRPNGMIRKKRIPYVDSENDFE